MRNLGDVIYKIVNVLNKKIERSRSFTNNYVFDNRQKKSENLILIVAGFQPYYWDEVFSRVQYSADIFAEGIDVCVCIPQGLPEAKSILQEKCKKLGWSCLYLKRDLLAQAQNVAIKLHPAANYIFKIDEDILLSKDYFYRLKKAYLNVKGKIPYPIGFMGPLINVNAYCSLQFLKSIGALEEYENRFGAYEVHGWEDDSHNKIHKSPEVGEFLWEKSTPFDQMAEHISNINNGKFSLSPVRYSIGAILFTRSFWDSIGFFKVGGLKNMGVEETQVCAFCMVHFFPIVVAEDVFVGHLGFYSQKEACRKFLEKNISQISLSRQQ